MPIHESIREFGTSLIRDVMDGTQDVISKHTIATGVGLGLAGGIGSTLATQAVIRTFKKRKKSKIRKARGRRRKVKVSRGIGRRKIKHRTSSGGKLRRHKTKHRGGKAIHFTKKGQPYRIMADGKARFIKKKKR